MDLSNILDLQNCQLSKSNEIGGMLSVGLTFDMALAEMSVSEGPLIPFAIRTGPIGKPDPGLLKDYKSVEINGTGQAFVLVWVQGRLVAWGRLFAQEGPRHPRRLNIPRGLGHGYDIDLFIAYQGRLTGYEVFFVVEEGGDE